MPTIREITSFLEQIAPSQFQETYDNAGLIVGNPSAKVERVLIALDSIESILEESLERNCNLIVVHHPIVFRGLKKITGKNYVERVVQKAIKNDLNIYASHTNLDNVHTGVNAKIAKKLGLENTQILAPKPNTLMKLTVFVPLENSEEVLLALGKAGAGQIGEYKNCSFLLQGTGTFQPSEKASPHIGEKGKLEQAEENRIEVIFPVNLQGKIMNALRKAHPYEEIAYYLHLLENENQEIGSGMIGDLPKPLENKEFLKYVKEKMNLKVIRHTQFIEKPIQKVALCGGSGSFLLKKAMVKGADAFVSADFKYHEFFDAEGKCIIADIGHYESEIYTTELFRDFLKKQFPEIKIHITEKNTNPIDYYF